MRTLEQTTIVVVDDNEAGRYAMARILRRAGYNVLEGATGSDALRLMSNRPEMLIVDVNMPDLSGFEVCERVKADPTNVATVVMLTSATSVEQQHRIYGLEGGADGYVIQPIDGLEFLANVKALLRLRAAADRATRLQQVTAALSTALDAHTAARLVVETGRRAVGAASGAVALLGEDGQALHVIYHEGHAPAATDGLGTEAARRRLPVTERLRLAEPYFAVERAAWQARYPELAVDHPNLEALAVVPLSVRDRRLGMLWLGFAGRRDFNSEERAFILTLAHDCALAIDRAELYAAERTARTMAEAGARRASLLAEVSKALTRLPEDDRVLERMARLVLPELGDYCSIFLVEADQQVSQAAAVHVDPLAETLLRERSQQPLPGSAADNLIGHAIQTGQSATLNDLDSGLSLRARLVVPLSARGNILGTLNFARAEEGQPYTPEETALAEDIGRRVAMALDNTRLYRDAQATNVRLEERVRERTAKLEEEIEERKRVEAQLAGSRQQLRDFSARLQAVREDEQARLSREIHDELGGALTAMKMEAAQIRRAVDPSEAALAGRIDGLLSTIDGMVQNVRRIATDLRPSILDDFGLATAIGWHLQDFEDRTGLQCRVDVQGGAQLRGDLATALFRIVQEALTNIVRHAQATRVTVRLEEQGHQITLTIRDNGRGLSSEDAARGGSLGLIGMRERAYALGGDFYIQGVPGEGTTIVVTVPLRRDQARQ